MGHFFRHSVHVQTSLNVLYTLSDDVVFSHNGANRDTGLESRRRVELFTVTRQVAPLTAHAGAKSAVASCLVLKLQVACGQGQ